MGVFSFTYITKHPTPLVPTRSPKSYNKTHAFYAPPHAQPLQFVAGGAKARGSGQKNQSIRNDSTCAD